MGFPATTDFMCCSNKPLCNDYPQAEKKKEIYIYIFVTFPARWTVETFILLLFGGKTLVFPSPDQTKTLNMLKRISAEHQHVGRSMRVLTVAGSTLLCLKPVDIRAVTKVGQGRRACVVIVSETAWSVSGWKAEIKALHLGFAEFTLSGGCPLVSFFLSFLSLCPPPPLHLSLSVWFRLPLSRLNFSVCITAPAPRRTTRSAARAVYQT